MKRSQLRVALGILVIALLLGAWQLAGSLHGSEFLSPLSTALAQGWDLVASRQFVNDVLPSVVQVLGGLIVGCAIGIVLGIVLGNFRGLDPWVRPVFEYLRATPLPAVVPVAIVAFSSSASTRIGLITLGVMWPVLLNAMDGTRGTDSRLIEAGLACGFSRIEVLWHVVFRSALPTILAGIRTAIGVALAVMVVSEMFGTSSGLGSVILQAQRTYNYPQMYGGIVLIGILGLIMTAAFTAIERRTIGWFFGQQGREYV